MAHFSNTYHWFLSRKECCSYLKPDGTQIDTCTCQCVSCPGGERKTKAERKATAAPSPPRATRHGVFISYSSRERPFAQRLAAALRQRRVGPVYMDLDLKRGRDVQASLFQAIGESKVCLAVLSIGYGASEFCRAEAREVVWSAMHDPDLRVVPVFYGFPPKDIVAFRDPLPMLGRFKGIDAELPVKDPDAFAEHVAAEVEVLLQQEAELDTARTGYSEGDADATAAANTFDQKDFEQSD